MNRIITVKGRGNVSAPPDWIKIIMSLEASDIDYYKAMDMAANQLKELRNCLYEHGFKKQDIKTTSFNIDTSYENVKDFHGNYKRIFKVIYVLMNYILDLELITRSLARFY